MRLLLRYVLPFLIALPLAFLLLYPQLLRCLRVGQSADFSVLTGTDSNEPVYVNRTATTRQQAQLRRHVRLARERIGRFWADGRADGRRGQAVLIYCPQQADYERYCVGGEGAGCSLGTPWGQSFLILGPDGNNADVIAHELCHDELFTRLGWWRTKRQIPQWFNEGLALMVDYRFSSPAVWEQPDSLATGTPAADSLSAEWNDDAEMPFSHGPMVRLSDLETTRDFFGGDYGHVMLAYQTAADEVARWLAVVGRAGVPALTDAVANGTDFGDAYRQLERTGRAGRKRRLK